MLQVKMAVSVTEGTGDNRKRKEIGTVQVFTPEMSEIAKIAVSAKETGKDETDGLPVFDSQEANWLFSAVYNAVKMAARNKLENKSISLKEGLSIAETMEALTEEGQRGGGGEGLAILREVKAAFGSWVATLGKSEATASYIITMFTNRAALATQIKSVKEKMSKYVEEFATTLTDEQIDRFSRPLEAIAAACMTPSTAEEAQDF